MPNFNEVEFRTFDYDGTKDSLFELAKGRFPEWTDVFESNQGVVFVEWLAFISANLAWMQNFQAKQHFVKTVTEAKNLTKLAKQFDYKIPNNQAASVDLKFYTEDGEPLTLDLIIPAQTQMRTTGQESLIFETTESLLIPAGTSFGIVPAKHQASQTQTETSDGSSDYKATLSFNPYVEESIEVKVNDIAWVYVDNFLDSNATSEHFSIEVDSNGFPTILFGNGINGKIPPAGDSILYNYKVGGGAKGIVAPEVITLLDDTFTDIGGNPISLKVTNEQASIGGVDREAIQVSKIKIPKSIAAKEATIDYQDFETVITNVAGVSRTRILTVNDNELIPENTVLAIVLSTEADELSEALEGQIRTALNKNPPLLTQNIILAGARFFEVEIEIQDLVVENEYSTDLGQRAFASIELTDNSFDTDDVLTINDQNFQVDIDWERGSDLNSSANNLATAIAVRMPEIETSVTGSVINLIVRTSGAHGNEYSLFVNDEPTSNFMISGDNFEGGEDSRIQANIRESLERYFGRENQDEFGEYTIDFGDPIYRNRIIWVIQDIEGVESFTLATPTTDIEMELNQFPIFSLKFTSS